MKYTIYHKYLIVQFLLLFNIFAGLSFRAHKMFALVYFSCSSYFVIYDAEKAICL